MGTTSSFRAVTARPIVIATPPEAACWPFYPDAEPLLRFPVSAVSQAVLSIK
jgi:hypothetical protein